MTDLPGHSSLWYTSQVFYHKNIWALTKVKRLTTEFWTQIPPLSLRGMRERRFSMWENKICLRKVSFGLQNKSKAKKCFSNMFLRNSSRINILVRFSHKMKEMFMLLISSKNSKNWIHNQTKLQRSIWTGFSVHAKWTSSSSSTTSRLRESKLSLTRKCRNTKNGAAPLVRILPQTQTDRHRSQSEYQKVIIDRWWIPSINYDVKIL